MSVIKIIIKDYSPSHENVKIEIHREEKKQSIKNIDVGRITLDRYM